jgi:4-phospho-D-threonate 3-dehydrogenase / 4-phospho-D-erythronate 3-dehydrogenase
MGEVKRMNARPIIAITMGDAAGVGPEVLAKVLTVKELLAICRVIAIGDLGVMNKAAAMAGVNISWQAIYNPEEAKDNAINIIDLRNVDAHFQPRRIAANIGKASMEYIETAARFAMEHKIDAMVTAPINKEATMLGGYADVGHLEYLARLTGAKEYATMLVSGRLRTIHLTTHHSLRDACNMVTRERVVARLKLSHSSFVGWGFPRPIIGVAALNPHGGEGGMMGREEIDEIEPAVKEARDGGIDARGPFPADSIFNRAINGEFDAVLAMYHDQGHIPVKVFGLEKSVSVALGLPFVRTSVDHGTAYDIAWQNKADPRSMEEAIRVAVSLARNNRLNQ